MKSEKHVQFWLEGAAHDLDASESLFAAGKYDWCLFLGHLVLEKTLKAILVQKQTEYFNKIKEFYQWLKSRITSEA